VPAPRLAAISISSDGRHFVRQPGGEPFLPIGFNYDHDEAGRLLEEYWEAEWPKVEQDFREMKSLGANVVRVHLQAGRFLESPDRARREALERLARLLSLAESVGIYLDITGLGSYLREDTPAWYDALDETGRWQAQATFWSAVAARCASSPAVFCYDLMNEPVVPGGPRSAGDWLGPPFGGKYHFVQFITLDPAGRPRPEVARQWIRKLAAAIRANDPRRLVTVGLVPWSLDRPGLTSGFVPEAIAPELDFICVHLYPEAGRGADALATLRAFQIGKPVLIEETFPLACPPEEFRQFLRDADAAGAGVVGFYWGRTLEECDASGSLPDALTAAQVRAIQEHAARRRG
jgi:hypothetical protein